MSQTKFIGSAACSGCHVAQGHAWQGSHHAQALQPARAGTVLGDFRNAVFEQQGRRSLFFTRAGRWFVHSDGREAEVTHVIGVYPLQQLLVAQPGGRLQAFPIAWDARAQAQGGQRWFSLYPDDLPPPGDPLHWAGREQTANFQCNGCHATDHRTGYDEHTDTYTSTQAEVGVGCEACHGPGSGHRAWAQQQHAGTRPAPNKGFATPQQRWNPLVFSFLPGAAIARPNAPVAQGQAASEGCLGCHARRSQLVSAASPDRPFLDQFAPALIEPGLYQPDGRLDGEVFEHGSFAQSAMHAAGVACTNCHDPHSAKPRAAGDALCSQCHLPTRYERPHPAGSSREPGQRCTDCHMPTRLYMGVHLRHDHSLRVPGAPARADSAFVQASALARGEALAPGSAALTSPDPLLRLGAARGLVHLPLPTALHWGSALLADERLAVRVEAARALAQVPRSAWPADQQARVQRTFAEWEAAERLTLDRPASVLNLVYAWLAQGRSAEAEPLLQRALQRAPDVAALQVAQAELLRQTGRDAQAQAPLQRALALAPRDATVLKTWAQWLIRQQRLSEALAPLQRAAAEAPTDPSIARLLAALRQALGPR